MSIHEFDRLEQFNQENLDWFVVNWCIGNTCNFSCTYCPTSLHDGSRKWHSLDSVKRFVINIKKTHPTKEIYFEFTGGEVTLNKDFIPICQYCHDNDVKVGFISNGSRTERWWEENKHYFDHVMLSFHSEFANPDNFCKIIETIRFHVNTHVNIMMKPDRWDYCLKIAEKIKNLGDVSIALQPLIHDLAGDLYDYTDDQKHVFDHQYEIIGKINRTKTWRGAYRGFMRALSNNTVLQGTFPPHVFIGKKQNNWFGWECHAGVEQLAVDIDGSIYRGWCKVGGAIGNVLEEELKLPNQPIVCNKTLCHCNFDIMCTKVRTEIGV